MININSHIVIFQELANIHNFSKMVLLQTFWDKTEKTSFD